MLEREFGVDVCGKLRENNNLLTTMMNKFLASPKILICRIFSIRSKIQKSTSSMCHSNYLLVRLQLIPTSEAQSDQQEVSRWILFDETYSRLTSGFSKCWATAQSLPFRFCVAQTPRRRRQGSMLEAGFHGECRNFTLTSMFCTGELVTCLLGRWCEPPCDCFEQCRSVGL